MTRALRPSLALAALLALGAASGASLADTSPSAPASTPAPARPAFSALPEVKLPAATIKVDAFPKRLAKTDKVEGFYVAEPSYLREARKDAKQKRRLRPEDTAYAQVTETADAQSAIETGVRDRPFATCFTESDNGTHAGEQGFQRSQHFMTTIYWTPKALAEATGNVPSVHLLRSEKLDRSDAAHPKLVVTIAFVDGETHGAKLVSRASHDLARILQGPGDLEVFGAREGKRVEIVVATPRQNNFTLLEADGNFSSASCDHATATMSVDAAGAAEMLGFLQEVTLGRPTQAPDDDAAPQGNVFRVRPVRLTASLAWLAKDPEPVLSFSTRWTDKERVEGR